MFFTSHLKRYINRYEKATFFALKTSHTNNLRVTSLAGNSYPYYQDKKEKDFSLRSNPLKKTQKTTFFNVVFYSSTKAPISSTNENWIKWDIFKIYIYVTVILTFKKGLILMKKADK